MTRKIAFLAPNMYPLFNENAEGVFGGGEVDLYHISVYFASRDDYKVTFYIGDYGQKNREVINNIVLKKIRYFGNTKKNLWQKLVYHIDLIQTLFFMKSDILFTEMATELVGFSGLFFMKPRLFKRKKAYVHRLASDLDTGKYSSKKYKKKWKFWAYRYGLNRASAVVAQTRWQKESLQSETALNAVIIPNGAALNNWDVQKVEGLKEKKGVLWVSRCHPVKRPEKVYELACMNSQIEFTLIMPIYNESISKEYRKKTEQWLEKAIELPNFNYIPAVAYKEIQKYYNQAKLLINTSVQEGFPNAFIQALMGRTPILSLKVNPDGFLDKYQVGESFNDNLEALSKRINDLLGTDNKDWETYSGNGYSYIENNYDIKQIGERYHQLFGSLIHQETTVSDR